jgi:hypothetical protein
MAPAGWGPAALHGGAVERPSGGRCGSLPDGHALVMDPRPSRAVGAVGAQGDGVLGFIVTMGEVAGAVGEGLSEGKHPATQRSEEGGA